MIHVPTMTFVTLCVLAFTGLWHVIGLEPLVVYWRRWRQRRQAA